MYVNLRELILLYRFVSQANATEAPTLQKLCIQDEAA